MEISGDLPLTELSKAGPALGARLYGWWRYLGIVVVVALIAFGVVAASFLDWLFRLPQLAAYGEFQPWAFILIYAGFLVIYVRACRGYSRWLQVRSAKARGYRPVIPVRFAVAQDGFHVTAEFSQTLVGWPGVTEIAPIRERDWLFITSGAGFVIPRRFFTGVDQERGFLRTALGYMSEAARARSAKAQAFAAD